MVVGDDGLIDRKRVSRAILQCFELFGGRSNICLYVILRDQLGTGE